MFGGHEGVELGGGDVFAFGRRMREASDAFLFWEGFLVFLFRFFMGELAFFGFWFGGLFGALRFHMEVECVKVVGKLVSATDFRISF